MTIDFRECQAGVRGGGAVTNGFEIVGKENSSCKISYVGYYNKEKVGNVLCLVPTDRKTTLNVIYYDGVRSRHFVDFSPIASYCNFNAPKNSMPDHSMDYLQWKKMHGL